MVCIISKMPNIKKISIREVKFGNNCTIIEPVNLYECELGENVFVGPFVEITKGVKIGNITLHIGLGTFRSIMVEDLTRHHMDSDYFKVPGATAIMINEARAKRKKIIPVGTSTVRALETVTVSGFQITRNEGWTDKFIYPPYKFKMCDQFITNFHQPKSTLMMLSAAFAKKDFLLTAYKEAIKKKYRFYSYGDSMMII